MCALEWNKQQVLKSILYTNEVLKLTFQADTVTTRLSSLAQG